MSKPWYEDLENAVIRREQWQARRRKITPFEKDILKREAKALETPYATYLDRQIDYFVNPYTGEWEQRETEVVVQDVKWILGFIQKELGGLGRQLSQEYLNWILHKISMAFWAAEYQTLERPLIQLPLPNFGVEAKTMKAA